MTSTIAIPSHAQQTLEDPEAAAAFIDYVQSHAGQAILEDHGFVVPQER